MVQRSGGRRQWGWGEGRNDLESQDVSACGVSVETQ